MATDSIATTRASYTRCLAAPDFLEAFYRNFFKACPGAEPMFAKTDVSRQAKLLQHAIGLLLIFPSQPKEEPTVLSRLAAKHGPGELNIDPTWFSLFLESLIETARQYDPQFSPAIAEAWREALTPGFAYLERHGR
jgi:hemoglobin-like flavoprotein